MTKHIQLSTNQPFQHNKSADATTNPKSLVKDSKFSTIDEVGQIPPPLPPRPSTLGRMSPPPHTLGLTKPVHQRSACSSLPRQRKSKMIISDIQIGDQTKEDGKESKTLKEGLNQGASSTQVT